MGRSVNNGRHWHEHTDADRTEQQQLTVHSFAREESVLDFTESTMRAFYVLSTALIASVATAIQLPDLQPFLAALPEVLQDLIPQSLQNETAHELLKRQSSGCPNSFKSCSNLGAPSLCCMSNAVCSADNAGHVACCPSGAVCTGTIGGVITAGTLNSNGALATATSNNGLATTGATTTTSFQMYTSATSNSNGLVQASATGDVTNSGFVIAGSSTVATVGSDGMRRAEIVSLVQASIKTCTNQEQPLIARGIIRMLELLPL